MRIHRIYLRGITRFRSAVDLDLDQLPHGLIAVIGPNGAGKSTILEAVPAALYRELPSRPGGLADSCGPNAVLLVELTYGATRYRITHEIDPTAASGRGRAEAALAVVDEAGGVRELVSSQRVTDFDEAVARIFPPRSVFLASAFGAQTGVGSFLRLDVAGRRELFARLLGLDGLQALAARAAAARKVADAVGADLDEADRRLLADRTNVGVLDLEAARLRAAITTTETSVGDLDRRAREARTVLDGLRATREEGEARYQAAVDEIKRHNERSARWTATALERAGELADVRALLRQGDEIRAAATTAAALTLQKADLGAAWHRDKAAVTVATAAAREAEVAVRATEAELATATREELAGGPARKRLAVVQTERAGHELRARGHAAAVERVTDAGTVVEQVSERRIRLARELDGAADRRAALDLARRQAAELDGLPCGADLQTACRLLAGARAAAARLAGLQAAVDHDDAVSVDEARALAEENEASAALDEARQLQADAWNAVAALAALDREAAALLPTVQRADEAITRKATLTADLEARRAVRSSTEATLGTALRDLATTTDEGHRVAAELREARRLGDRLAELDTATAEEARLAAAVTEAENEARAARADAAAVVVPAAPTPGGLDAAEAVVRTADAAATRGRRELDQVRADLGRIEGQVDARGDLEARARQLQAARERVAIARSGWRLLEQGLGEKGLQAIEIDAAGPTVSGLVNGLLEAAWGPRFAVLLRTVRPAEGRKVQKETFDLRILDGERGGERDHSGLSGGEQVIIDEAVKLGLALFNAGRSGLALSTLWRDEADGRLDSDTALRYPAILRRAADLGGFERVFYVTHRAEVAEQADARILVGADGSVEVAP